MSRLVDPNNPTGRLVGPRTANNDLDTKVETALNNAAKGVGNMLSLAGWLMANPGKAVLLSLTAGAVVLTGFCLLVKAIFF